MESGRVASHRLRHACSQLRMLAWLDALQTVDIYITCVHLQDTVYIPGHGKLLLDEALFPKSYATNVHEQWLNTIDLDQRARTGSFDFADSIPSCTGTHSIVYSNISQQ